MDPDLTAECCVNNVDVSTLDRLGDADVEVTRQHCLQRCGVCREGPFLVVDGAPTRGDSHEAILTALDAGDDA